VARERQLSWGTKIRRRRNKKRRTTFSLGHGCESLTRNQFLHCSGQRKGRNTMGRTRGDLNSEAVAMNSESFKNGIDDKERHGKQFTSREK